MVRHLITHVFEEGALAQFSALHDAQPRAERRAFRRAMKEAFSTRQPYYAAWLIYYRATRSAALNLSVT